MAAKVREKFALLVQEKTALQEKCEQLEKQLAMGGVCERIVFISDITEVW